MNNPAFESQQFADQVQTRREGHVRDQGAIFAQGVQGAVAGYQQGQQHQMQMARQAHQMRMEDMQVASEFALNEQRRQSALEELQWARELHTTDMLKMQKDAMAAETALKIAQAEKARDGLSGSETEAFRMTERDRDAALAAGLDITFANGRPTVVEADPAKRKAAEDRMAAGEFAQQVGRMDLQNLGMQGYTADFETRKIRPMTEAESAGFAERMRYRTPTSTSRDITAKTRAIESLLAINQGAIKDAKDALKDAPSKDKGKAQQQLDKLLAERESLAKQLREMAGGGGGDASPVQEQEPAPPGPDASPDDLRRYRWDQLNRTLEKALQEQANAVK